MAIVANRVYELSHLKVMILPRWIKCFSERKKRCYLPPSWPIRFEFVISDYCPFFPLEKDAYEYDDPSSDEEESDDGDDYWSNYYYDYYHEFCSDDSDSSFTDVVDDEKD